MNKALRIRIGKQDQLIKNWWAKLAENDINISASINNCIAYYVKTGTFLEIARIPVVLTEYESEVKKYYLPEESISYKWLLERQKEGENQSTIVKRILRNSIKITEGEAYITPPDELAVAVEQAGIVRYTTQITEDSSPKPIQRIAKMEERTIHVPSKQEEIHENSGNAEEVSDYDRLFNRNKEEEEDFDLYQLMGHSLTLQ